MSTAYQNILVTRTDRIGDVILSLPAAAAIKAQWPSTRVTFYVRSYAAPVVEMCPWVDDIIIAEDTDDPTSDVETIANHEFDAAVCLFPEAHIAARLKSAKIPVRVGTARRLFSFRFNRRVNMSRAAGGKHERDYNLDLLRGLDIGNPSTEDPKCEPSAKAIEAARSYLSRYGFSTDSNQPTILIHPGCGGSARNWPVPRYKDLCQWFVDNRMRIILSGSSSERSIATEICDGLTGDILNAAGETDLPTLAALMTNCTAFVGPSTGPMHLAAAVGVPVVALFGPVRTTGPDRWGPLGKGHAVIETGLPVCDCPLNQCKVGDCMERIDVSSVGEKVAAISRAQFSQ